MSVFVCLLHNSLVRSFTRKMELTQCLIRSSFLFFCVGQAPGHPTHGHRLEVPVRAVRLVMVFSYKIAPSISCDSTRSISYVVSVCHL